MIKNKLVQKITVILLAILLAAAGVGCKGNSSANYSDMILVIYEGNGGYLRNKTDTVRKILVEPNSKIPCYEDEITNNPYTTSSLGLATRVGYNLMGWYTEDKATYIADSTGTFVYLNRDDGNGVYTFDKNGDFLLGYVENVNGKIVIIEIEEPLEGTDLATIEYIYYQGSNGYGFYIYDSDNAEHADVYASEVNIYDINRHSYKATELKKFTLSYLYDDLTATEKVLFEDLTRYNREYYLRDETDVSIERYSLNSGYASIDSIMELDKKGDYVLIANQFERYDAANPLHGDIERYSIAAKYSFQPTAGVETPSDLNRYKANIEYWDFTKDRVTEPIILLAHWSKKCTVSFIQKSGQITSFTTKFNPEKTKEIDLVEGNTIGKAEQIPQYSGFTFVGWSKSEVEYQPWDFNIDVFPEGTTQLNLYGYMIPGNYTRITTAFSLAAVASNPSGNYLLCNDIDLEGKVFSNISPLGFAAQNMSPSDVFTGTFVSLGFEISNFTIQVSNLQKVLNVGERHDSIGALFPYVENATIEGVHLRNMHIILSNGEPRSSYIIYNLGGSGLVGEALTGNTIINDCSVDVTFSKTANYVLDSDVYIGDIIAHGKENVTMSQVSATLNYAAISGITTGNLIIEKLN